MTTTNWEELSSTPSSTWRPEINETVEGTLVDFRQKIGPNESNVYTLSTDDGELDLWGCTVLDRQLPSIPLNTRLRIQFLGMQNNPATNRSYKGYKIWRAS